MIGLVVVTHGRLAEEFIAAAQHVVGQLENVQAVCIGPDDDMDMRRKEIIAAAKACDTGAGVVILTDMFGGTPSNLAISVMGGAKIEVTVRSKVRGVKSANRACASSRRYSPAATKKPHVPAAGSQITSCGVGCVISTISRMMWRGVRNWPFCPALAILPSMYS